MVNVAETVEEIFIAHASEIDGLTTVQEWEPGEIDRKKMPLLAFFFLLPESHDTETGPTEDVDYRWEVSLYVSLVDFKQAQAEMKTLSQAIVTNFRQHRSDYSLSPDADLFARTLRRRVPPTPSETSGYMRASWELQVTCGED